MLRSRLQIAQGQCTGWLWFYKQAKSISENAAKTNADLLKFIVQYVEDLKFARDTPERRLSEIMQDYPNDSKESMMEGVLEHTRQVLSNAISVEVATIEQEARAQKTAVPLASLVNTKNQAEKAAMQAIDMRLCTHTPPKESLRVMVQIAATYLNAYEEAGFARYMTPFEKTLLACYEQKEQPAQDIISVPDDAATKTDDDDATSTDSGNDEDVPAAKRARV